MVGITELSAVFSSLTAARDIAKGIVSLNSETEKNQAVIEIQQILLDAQAAALEAQQRQSELQHRIDQLEKIIENHDSWENDKDRYRLAEFSDGCHAYVLKEGMENSEPQHKLCVKCWSDGVKSILITKTKHSVGEKVRCQNCKEEFTLMRFNHSPEVISVRGRDRFTGF